MESAAVAASGGITEDPQLKANAITFLSNIVIGVASTAPAYSLASSLGLVAAAVGVYAASSMLVAFIPMIMIAAAYYWMNRADPDCGTTFAWVSRAMGPSLGWLGGWGIFVTDMLVMPSLSYIAGKYTFALFGNNNPSLVLDHRHRRRLDRRDDLHLLHRHRAVGSHPAVPARRRVRDPHRLRASSRSSRSTADRRPRPRCIRRSAG